MKRFILFVLSITVSLISFSQDVNLKLRSGNFNVQETYDLTVEEETNFRFMVLESIPTEKEKESIKNLGISFLEYIPINAGDRTNSECMFIVSYSENIDIDALKTFGVTSMLPILPEYKLERQLQYGNCPGYALDGDYGLLKVILHQNINVKSVKNELNSISNIEKIDNIDGIIYVKVLISEFNALASLDFVAFIEPIDPPSTIENNTSRTLIRSNVLDSDYPTGRSYNGNGVGVVMRDDGLVSTGGTTGTQPHPDMKGRVNESGCWSCSSGSGGDHGDHCAGTILGAGNVDPRAKGMAVGADLFTFLGCNNDNFDSIPAIYNSNDVFISSSSQGNGCNQGYTSLSNKLDKQVRDYPSLMHVFSCGNSGNSDCGNITGNYNLGNCLNSGSWSGVSYLNPGAGWGNITGGHKQAKNVIAVGNLNSSGVVANSSSRGPAADGRIKPDLCAKGTSVWSTDDPSDLNIYYTSSGTSMACPAVAGTLALLHEAYRDLNGGQDANAGLLKCLLLNTADDIGNPGPDFTHGWGEVNAYKAVKTLEQGRYFSGSVSTGNTNTHSITVPSDVKEIKVMVYWNDPEASTLSATALVNDIDITLTTPGGTSYNPWRLDPTPNATNLSANATRGFDWLNNMEQVTLNASAFLGNQFVSLDLSTGNYVLNVNGWSIPDGPQEYWVVYEFLSDSIDVTYPIGGEGLVPGESEIIRWDTYGSSGTFDIEYSLDNGSVQP